MFPLYLWNQKPTFFGLEQHSNEEAHILPLPLPFSVVKEPNWLVG